MMPMAGPAGLNRSDESGAFTLDGVVAGNYTLIAIAPVVIATTPAGAPARPEVNGSSMSMTGGPVRMVTTETRDGTTIQFRDDAGTHVPVTVAGGHVAGLQVVVQR